MNIQALHVARSRSMQLMVALVAVAVSGCGGGGESPAPPPPTTTSVAVTVIDGALKGAVICLDKNSNGVCDSGEPTATTDANGAATLTVALADAGKYPMIAMVGTDAVDADTGAVATAYVLQAPADQPAVISPLTTLVQAQIVASGISSTAAASIVQTQAGLNVSPLVDYTLTRSTSPDAASAANLARLLVLATQQQTTALAPDIGQTDISGSTVTLPNLQSAIVQALLSSLPVLSAAAGDPSVAAALTAAGKDAALATLATSAIATGQFGLTPSAALVAAGLSKMPPDVSAPSGVPSGAFRAFTFTDANDWSYRTSESTAADNMPDATGLTHYEDVHTQDVGGTVTSWGFSNSLARQGDLHWDGSSWVGCALGFKNSQTPRDASGISSYNYCDLFETGISRRASVDIGGNTLTSVIATIRAIPGSDSGVTLASFGPTDLGLLGTSTFPTGSKLFYYLNQAHTEAYAYNVLPAALVSSFSIAVAAGGNSSSSPAPACAAVTPTNGNTFTHLATSLDDMIASAPGTPCVNPQATAADGSKSLPSNDNWGMTTLSLGTIGGALTAPTPYYSTTENLRVSFAPASNAVTYYSCFARASDGSTRNCRAIGIGTYSIQTLGDARIVTMTKQPLEVTRLGSARIYVERAGSVYAGYQDYLGATNTVRLNLAAANALLTQLGLAPIVPN